MGEKQHTANTHKKSQRASLFYFNCLEYELKLTHRREISNSERHRIHK